MNINEKINSMSDDEIKTVTKIAIEQNPCDHEPLYGVDFETWVEILYLECNKRNITI